VQLPPALAQRVLATLLWPSDEAVQRNRHMARGLLHNPSLADLKTRF
jgi:hypothetical protein